MVAPVVSVAICFEGQFMTNKENFRLCGGTFFTLLLRARKQRMGVREHYKGMSDGMADPILLMDLVEIAKPDYQFPDHSMMGTVKSATSRYKSCQANGGTYLPVSDDAVIASFDARVKSEYGRCLSAMNSYVEDYIDVGGDTKKDEYLVKALVEVLDADDQIDNGQVFYVCEDGSTMTKTEILVATELCLQPFLIGLWHYIIVNVSDNRVGADTYNRWCPSRGGAERLYIAKLGETSSRNISLTYSTVPETETKHETEAETVIDTEVVEPEPEKVEAAPPQTMVNNNPVFNTFNFHGPVGQVISHVDQITNNYYGGKKDE